MIDVTTKQPLRVANEGDAGPYIELPYDQLAEVRRLLDRHGVRYYPHEDVFSFNGGPYIATIDFGRGADPDAIQSILDDAP
jgi:hypothetical protein